MGTKLKLYKKAKSKKYLIKPESVFMLGSIHKEMVPELKIRFTKGKRFLGVAKESTSAADFLRKVYPISQIEIQEIVIVLYLNNANQILGYYKHSIGAITSTIIDVRIIFGVALKCLATSIIVSHNHPSGNTKPSKADLEITQNLKNGGKLLDIDVLDHIIITKKSFYSFSDEGDL